MVSRDHKIERRFWHCPQIELRQGAIAGVVTKSYLLKHSNAKSSVAMKDGVETRNALSGLG